MPHKRNPVGSTLARACAMRARSASALLTEAMVQEHERGAGSWHSEWRPLTQLLTTVGSAASWLRTLLETLEVDVERMTERAPGDTGAAARLVDKALESR